MTTGTTKHTEVISAQDKAVRIARVADAAKAENVVVLDVRNLSSVTDFFVILTGSSQSHLRAIGKRLEEELSKEGIEAEHVDGRTSTKWIVFDYGTVIVHAMLEETRKFYDLERLWGDAPLVHWKESIPS
ncbi:MAG: ribosome silencing factor [Candidatus Sumerlaeaceae bacterium]|nr:ribosome silencing factor [Candidatus Sumerlaeaceae bacterium]